MLLCWRFCSYVGGVGGSVCVCVWILLSDFVSLSFLIEEHSDCSYEGACWFQGLLIFGYPCPQPLHRWSLPFLEILLRLQAERLHEAQNVCQPAMFSAEREAHVNISTRRLPCVCVCACPRETLIYREIRPSQLASTSGHRPCVLARPQQRRRAHGV